MTLWLFNQCKHEDLFGCTANRNSRQRGGSAGRAGHPPIRGPVFDPWLLQSAHKLVQKKLWNPIWTSGASGLANICRNLIGLAFENHFQMWLFHVVLLLSDFLKSVWIQSGYTRKMIWSDSLNKPYGYFSCMEECVGTWCIPHASWCFLYS